MPISFHEFPPLNLIPVESLDFTVVAGGVPSRNKVEGLAVGPLPWRKKSAVVSSEAMIGVIVPVNCPADTNVRPVMNAVALFGSSPAPASIPRTRNRFTPPEGNENSTPDWTVA